MKYTVELIEQFVKNVQVEAPTEEAARNLVMRQYEDGTIEMNWNDFLDIESRVFLTKDFYAIHFFHTLKNKYITEVFRDNQEVIQAYWGTLTTKKEIKELHKPIEIPRWAVSTNPKDELVLAPIEQVKHRTPKDMEWLMEYSFLWSTTNTNIFI